MSSVQFYNFCLLSQSSWHSIFSAALAKDAFQPRQCSVFHFPSTLVVYYFCLLKLILILFSNSHYWILESRNVFLLHLKTRGRCHQWSEGSTIVNLNFSFQVHPSLNFWALYLLPHKQFWTVTLIPFQSLKFQKPFHAV